MRGLRPPALVRSLAVLVIDLRRAAVDQARARDRGDRPATLRAMLEFRRLAYDARQHPLGGYLSVTLHVIEPAQRIHERTTSA